MSGLTPNEALAAAGFGGAGAGAGQDAYSSAAGAAAAGAMMGYGDFVDYESDSSSSSSSSDDELGDGDLPTAASLPVDDRGRRLTAVGTVDMAPAPLVLPGDEQPFDVAFHPSAEESLIAVGCVSGRVQLAKLGMEAHAVVGDHAGMHGGAVNALRFSTDGAFVVTAGSDHAMRVLDVARGGVAAHTVKAAHDTRIGALQVLGPTSLLAGDDNGVVKLWDLRARSASHTFHHHTDFVSSFMAPGGPGGGAWDHGQRAVSLGGDGRLCVYNLRKGSLEAQSEDQEDELLAGDLFNGGRRCAVGTQAGVIGIWGWGNWGDTVDRFPGHPHSVDAVVSITDSLICTGSSDGIIRICTVHPDKGLIGVVGAHGNNPVEQLRRAPGARILASCSHDNTVVFWDISYLHDDDDAHAAAAAAAEAEAAAAAAADPEGAAAASAAAMAAAVAAADPGAAAAAQQAQAGAAAAVAAEAAAAAFVAQQDMQQQHERLTVAEALLQQQQAQALAASDEATAAAAAAATAQAQEAHAAQAQQLAAAQAHAEATAAQAAAAQAAAHEAATAATTTAPAAAGAGGGAGGAPGRRRGVGESFFQGLVEDVDQ